MIPSRWFSRLTICAAFLVLPQFGCPKSTPSSGPPQQQEPDDAPSLGPGPSGSFDYYVLSLSWSPQFCNSRKFPPSDQQCGEGRRISQVGVIGRNGSGVAGLHCCQWRSTREDTTG